MEKQIRTGDKVKVEIFIPYQLPRQNQIIEASKRRVPWLCKGKKVVYEYTLMKSEWMNRISPIFLQPEMPKFKGIYIDFVFYEKDRSFNPDNVAAGARKIIFDTMIKCKVLKNDGWKQIGWGWNDKFIRDKENPGVYMLIEEKGEYKELNERAV